MAKKSSNHRSRNAIKVGQRVIYRLGTRRYLATVVEDRGPIGRGGRRIVRIKPVRAWGDDDPSFEVPAEELLVSSH